ncbi:helicase associated domain-containing protein [Streptomyces sp. 3N207]|uniref:helicase associated domain-containing protein n=1 Tax=Streptomyces sp. 3N207 TaxID=3457417 RepID=UPI003FD0647A
MRTRVLRPESTAWLTGLEAVRTYAAAHGHANIPYTATVDLGDHNVAYPAGQWAAEQRRAWRRGELADWRTELLAETGFVFDPRDQSFTEFLDVCALYFAEHHTLAAPRDAVLVGVAVGERLHQARKPGGWARGPSAQRAGASGWRPLERARGEGVTRTIGCVLPPRLSRRTVSLQPESPQPFRAVGVPGLLVPLRQLHQDAGVSGVDGPLVHLFRAVGVLGLLA